MEIGDKVLFYTHNGNNPPYDELALVTSITESEDRTIVGLVVFPDGGPVRFERRIEEFDPDWPYSTPGSSFFRPVGEDIDFGDYYAYENDQEMIDLRRRQLDEYNNANPEDRDATIDRHKKEMSVLREKLAKRYPQPKEPANA